jgi:hypothetical protein
MPDSRAIRMRAVLDGTYLIVFAGFLLVVAAFTRDRACVDHLNLIPGIARRPVLAWLLAVMYVLGYAWAAVAYALTVREAGALFPTVNQAHAIWGEKWPRPVLLLIVALVDYTPSAVLRTIAKLAGICGAA